MGRLPCVAGYYEALGLLVALGFTSCPSFRCTASRRRRRDLPGSWAILLRACPALQPRRSRRFRARSGLSPTCPRRSCLPRAWLPTDFESVPKERVALSAGLLLHTRAPPVATTATISRPFSRVLAKARAASDAHAGLVHAFDGIPPGLIHHDESHVELVAWPARTSERAPARTSECASARTSECASASEYPGSFSSDGVDRGGFLPRQNAHTDPRLRGGSKPGSFGLPRRTQRWIKPLGSNSTVHLHQTSGAIVPEIVESCSSHTGLRLRVTSRMRCARAPERDHSPPRPRQQPRHLGRLGSSCGNWTLAQADEAPSSPPNREKPRARVVNNAAPRRSELAEPACARVTDR